MRAGLPWLFLPWGAMCAALLLSFAAWLLPDFGILRKGYEHREVLGEQALLLLLAWYTLSGLAGYAGFALGSRWRIDASKYSIFCPLDEPAGLLALRLLTWLGIGYAWVTIGSGLGLSGVQDAIAGTQGNDFTKALYESYSIGVASLRYGAILLGGLAIWRVLTDKSVGPGTLFDVAALGLNAVVSSRLSIVAASVIGILLVYAGEGRLSVRAKRKLLIYGCVAFAALTLLNSLRNTNYYESQHVYNPWIANVSEIVAYLGSPFQGSVWAANEYVQLVRKGEDIGLPNVEENLTTNSAFLELITHTGALGWFVAPLILLLSALIMGVCARIMSTWFALMYGVLLYNFLEYWRIMLFTKGISLTLLALVAVAALVSALARYNKSKDPLPYTDLVGGD
jgi:hypothetical protein